jgi:alpha-tubulin suppressor-like RCC1 family protein
LAFFTVSAIFYDRWMIVPRVQRLAVYPILGFVLLSVAATGGAQTKAESAAGKITAYLTATTFTKAQASRVTLVYRFSSPSSSLAYLIARKHGARWLKVRSVARKGSFSGSHQVSLKKLFGRKPIEIGRYRLRLRAGTSGVSLFFAVVAKLKPVELRNIAFPTISGSARVGQKLESSPGIWRGIPDSFSYSWRRCSWQALHCVAIRNAVSSAYVVGAADVGHTVRVVVEVVNTAGYAWARSAVTAVVKDAVTGISAGDNHACAVFSNGAVKCWGSNTYGQLGDGTTIDSPVPVAVTGITGAIAVSAGGTHSCALLAKGEIKCWGVDNSGELGTGSFSTYSATPMSVVGISTATAISAGEDHSCALLEGGSVSCWGYNAFGQLGDGTKNASPTPLALSGIAGAIAVGAGNEHSCALLSSGKIKCWGYNGHGQLGDGTTADSLTPVEVIGIANAVKLSAGGLFTCAARKSGAVSCWGLGDVGELGNGSTSDSDTPVVVADISNAAGISAGRFHACALIGGGKVFCWGTGENGQLGNGASVNSSTPVAVAGAVGVTAGAVDAGGSLTCVLLSTGSALCFGANNDGQLGNGGGAGSSTPVAVSGI